MGFDLKIFLIQIVNLFLLVWLLKHFLYRPVLEIIDKRRNQIANSVKDANEKLASAAEIEADLEKQRKNFDAQRQKRFDELDHEIQAHRAQVMKELELNYKAKRQAMQQELDQSWSNAENSIREMIAKEFVLLSQDVLSEWSNQTPMDQALTLFIKKVTTLPKKKKSELQRVLNQQKTIQILTSETLNKKQQDLLQRTFQQKFTLSSKTHIQFKRQADLILGLEMRLGDFVLDWNLNTYLQEMEERLKQQISGLIVPVHRKDDK